MACVRAPDLGLQIILRDRPAWRKLPVALVSEDRPDAPLVVLNACARAQGLSVGVRHGAARSLVPALRTAVVPAERERETVSEMAEALRWFSPRVEPDAVCAGLFTVDPTGMGSLHRSPRAWGLSVRRALAALALTVVVVVGFERDLVRAIGHHARGVVVTRSAHEERARAGEVPLAALGLPFRALHDLTVLDVVTLGDLWSLPPETVRVRFGDAVAGLRAWGDGGGTLPVQPDVPREPVRAVIEVEPPDDDLARLLFALRGALHLLVARLSVRGEAVSALALTLSLDDHTRRAHRVETAAPTRDVTLLVELARLRLSEDALSAAVGEVTVEVEPAPLRGEQLALFAHDRARDRNAADRALARVRAAFGDASVTRARLRDAHLPEAGFVWEPLSDLTPPTPLSLAGEGGAGARVHRDRAPPSPARERGALGGEVPERGGEGERQIQGASPLIRRLFIPPRELTHDELRVLEPVAHPESEARWLRVSAANDVDASAARARWAHAEPSRVSGGWWVRTVERDYFYAEGRDGRLLWLFFDRARGRWFVHGVVD